METKDLVNQRINELKEKIEYMNQLAKDASEYKYWGIAREARKEAQLAKSEINGLTIALGQQGGNDASSEQHSS